MKFWKHALAALLAVCGILAALPETAYAAPDQIEEALAWAVEIAEDDSHGYDKDNRCGPDYDCSSFVSYALIAAGFELDGPVSTCTMKDALAALGFKAYRRGEVEPRRGDILLDPLASRGILPGQGPLRRGARRLRLPLRRPDRQGDQRPRAKRLPVLPEPGIHLDPPLDRARAGTGT